MTIDGRLPGLNEYINAERRNRYAGAKMKKEWQRVVGWFIGRMPPAPIPCWVKFVFYEPNGRRDVDNVSGFAHKIIFDALVEHGVLKGDGQKYVAGYTDKFEIDCDRPRIEVTITGVKR